jgi:Protein of unknown function (DUF992)
MKRSFSVPALSVPALAEFLGAALAGLTASAASAEPFQAGVLACNVAPGFGLILGSSKDISCVFRPSRGRWEFYYGRINRVGIDLGGTSSEQLSWAVVAPSPRLSGGALAGSYSGAGAGFAIGSGTEADTLVGETNGVTLLPIFGASSGLTLSGGIGVLNLQPAATPAMAARF